MIEVAAGLLDLTVPDHCRAGVIANLDLLHSHLRVLDQVGEGGDD